MARDAAAADPGTSLEFDRDIRPILSDNCFACHGPDEAARKARLRLDLKEDALKPNRRGDRAIVPGDPARSTLIQRIRSLDPDDVMPPPATNKTLSEAQKDALERWIAEGASWADHWAFTPPRRPEPPRVRDEQWPKNDTDRFVLSRLEREGLKPSAEAGKTTLIRRATLDLTGLPPTVEEVDAYLADKSPDAYEKLVDRLLASQRYGEHMARYWLDAARYADSHGYHIDAQRDIWAYREWVIKAFNENKPFDQFTLEQLAGDLLPNPTRDQQIATGYLRSNMSTGEGGAIEAEYAAKYAFDRTETTGTVWLGLTLICARCHTHKYDPITQREYFQMLAFFNQLDEPVMDGNRPNPDPFIRLPSPQQTARLDWLKQQLAEAQARVDGPDPDLDPAQAAWATRWHERLASGWHLLRPSASKSVHGATLTTLESAAILASGESPETDVLELAFPLEAGRIGALRLRALPHASLPGGGATRSEDGEFRLSEFEADLVVIGPDGQARAPQKIKFAHAWADAWNGGHEPAKALDGKPDSAWGAEAQAGSNRTAIFVTDTPITVPSAAELRVRLRFEADKQRHALGHFDVAAARGEELLARLFPPRFTPWKLIGPFKTGGLKAGFEQPFPPEVELDFAKTYPGVREEIRWHDRADLADGATHQLVNELHGVHGAYYLHRTIHVPAATPLALSLRADDLFKLWLNGELVAERADPDQERGVARRLMVNLQAGENRLLVKMVNHQGAKHFAFNAALAGEDALSPEVAALLATTVQPTGTWAAKARDHYRREHSAEFRALFDNLARWREEQAAIEAAIPTTLVAKELAKPRETRILLRGEYDKPRDPVSPGVFSVLPPLPEGAPSNRLGFARWLLEPQHPLTARVTVNRIWQQHFGTGLVKTVEDFGAQGERPSHPELLDWLATEFVRSGWDMKHLHRLMVTSATYRQVSRVTPELLARDPENRLLARGPRFRTDGEVVRDSALFMAGLLVEQLGGPSVKPYEPPGLWEAVSFNNSQKYVPDRGPAQYRRSLYTYWKRQSPPPNMLTFDAPTRETCTVRRPRTNTPLQALVLLNDPQFVEAARGFAERVLREAGPTAEARLTYAYRIAVARPPSTGELGILRGVLEQQLEDFRANTHAAGQFLSVGDSRPAAGGDPVELAAWTTITSLLLNLDETVTKG